MRSTELVSDDAFASWAFVIGRATLAVAERPCRAPDRIDPAGMSPPSGHLRRGSPEAHSSAVCPISLVLECGAFRPRTTWSAARRQRIGVVSTGMASSWRLFSAVGEYQTRSTALSPLAGKAVNHRSGRGDHGHAGRFEATAQTRPESSENVISRDGHASRCFLYQQVLSLADGSLPTACSRQITEHTRDG